MKRTKQQKEKFNQGITLVALVVTIVVLLILAGVSLNLVLGRKRNNIKSKGSKHKDCTSSAKFRNRNEFVRTRVSKCYKRTRPC